MAETNPYKHKPPTEFTDITKLGIKNARYEVENLREALEYHNYLYYVKNSPKISDEVYDKLFRRLLDLEKAFPELQSVAHSSFPIRFPAHT